MNHNTKPHFQTVVEKQRLAHYVLTNRSRRSDIELAAYQRNLLPCPISGMELPQLPLVRLKNGDEACTKWVVLGEIAQTPGKVLLLDIVTGAVELTYSADDLELVPPG